MNFKGKVFSMERRLSYIDVDEALRRTERLLKFRLETDTVHVLDGYRRVLAEDAVSPGNIPYRDRSHFDGYAVRAEDTRDASTDKPVLLKVVGQVRLDKDPTGHVENGEAYYVPTGGCIPQGADTVIPVERIVTVEGGRIRIVRGAQLGEYIIHTGDDVKRGEAVLLRHHMLRAQDIGILSSLGITHIKAFKKPTVALLPVGDELTTKLDDHADGKVFASHAYMIAKLILETGATPLQLKIASDDVKDINLRLRQGLDEADMVLTIGGSSMGEKDLVAKAVNSLGQPGMVFHGIKAKPGRVSGLGIVEGKPVVLLPGLILSTIVGYYCIAYPLILKLSGISTSDYWLPVPARMAEEVRFNSYLPFKKFTFVKLTRNKDGFEAKPVFGDSALLSVLIKVDGFVVTQEHVEVIRKGEYVDVHRLPGLSTV